MVEVELLTTSSSSNDDSSASNSASTSPESGTISSDDSSVEIVSHCDNVEDGMPTASKPAASPTETVIDTHPKQIITHSMISPAPYEDLDDFPFFDPSSHDLTPESDSKGLSSEKVHIDRPQTVADVPPSDVIDNDFPWEDDPFIGSETPPMAHASDRKLRVNVFPKSASNTPTTNTSVPHVDIDAFDGEILEIPRPETSDGLEATAESRFFGENQRNNELNALFRSAPCKVGSPKRTSYATSNSNPYASSTQVTMQAKLTETNPQSVVAVCQKRLFRNTSDPIVHSLSLDNRPQDKRTNIPIKDLFTTPISNLWRSKFDTFNQLQSEVATKLAHTNDNVVVSAPTGAGKTALFEISMARLFTNDLQDQNREQSRTPAQVSDTQKIVYIAPGKALCEERYDDWTCRLSDMNIGVKCAMITGDAEPGDSFREVGAAHVILTTPEKWDSMTRRWTENLSLFGSVRLLMLDEVHHLGDESHGCCLESVVCRMKTIQEAFRAASESTREESFPNIGSDTGATFLRILAVSATLPNVANIASFVGANEAFSFDASHRPVPLTIHVVGLGFAGNKAFMFGKSLDRHVPELIKRLSKGKPTIVFCHTKKEAENLSTVLTNTNVARNLDGVGSNVDVAGQTKLPTLQRCLLRGIAYHHAGLDPTDRRLVEKSFMEGKVTCLCATSTLAMGVNLPAHLVIIKGTMAWRGSGMGHQEIDTATLLQMMGRAGRPGFDTSGTAVIMTDNASKSTYENLSGGLDVVESQLPKKLIDVMNSEISQRVITSLSNATDWIKCTFFFHRARENPDYYGLPKPSGRSLDIHLRQLCQDSLRKLHDQKIIVLNDETGNVSPTTACHVMSQHMVEFDAMKKIIDMPFDADRLQLIEALSKLEGLHRPVRRSEKKILNDVHKLIKYKLDGPVSKVRVQTPTQKAFVLLQASIGQHYLEDFTLRQEMSSMVEYAIRMLAATEEFSIDGSKHGQVGLQSLRLRRSLATSLWGASDGVLNQLRGVGQKTTAKLRFSKILSFADVPATTSEAIELASARISPFGQELRIAVRKFLKTRFDCQLISILMRALHTSLFATSRITTSLSTWKPPKANQPLAL